MQTWKILRWALLAIFAPKKADEETRQAVREGHY